MQLNAPKIAFDKCRIFITISDDNKLPGMFSQSLHSDVDQPIGERLTTQPPYL